MAFTALRTWTAGEVVTAAQLNEQLRDNGNEYIQRSGTVPLTASWDAGAFEIRALTFFSDASAGVAPLTISSSTVVTNLNADLFDGQERTLNVNADHTHQSTGAQGGQLDHGLALTGLTDDDHTQYILKSVLAVAGDTLYASSASTPARLAKGTALQQLRMNSGATAPEWGTPAVNVFSKTVSWDSASVLTITTLPPGSFVFGINANTTVSWNGNTNPGFNVGDAGATAGLLGVIGAPALTTGWTVSDATEYGTRLYDAGNKYHPYCYTTSTDIIASLQSSASVTQGTTQIYLYYMGI